MPDYTKAVIYKICCKDVEVKDEYIGSTLDFLKRRQCHKTRCTNENDSYFNI